MYKLNRRENSSFVNGTYEYHVRNLNIIREKASVGVPGLVEILKSEK